MFFRNNYQMNIQIVNKTGFKKIDQAIELFWERIGEQLDEIYQLPEDKYFTYTEDTNNEVVAKVRHFLNSDREVKIYSYRPWKWWSRVIGYTKGQNITINSRKINSLSVDDYAGHIAHEILGHMVGYGHGNNYWTKKKKYSWPYFIGYLISGKMTIQDLVNYNEQN
jgi:hypothetical protein